MRIRLADIVDHPFHWDEQRVVGPEVLEDERLVGLGEISWSGTVTPTIDGYVLEARLRYEQTLICRRCLENVSVPVDAALELLVQARRQEPVLGEIELDADDLDVLWVEEDVLETEPLLLEQLELNIPMTVLCREDCDGLCPECGANLNRTSCGCRSESTDPRWAVLQGLGRSER